MTALGERPRANGDRYQSYAMRSVDTLPQMSRHAFRLAEAALGCLDLQHLSRAALTGCSLSWIAHLAPGSGPVLDCLADLQSVVETSFNTSSENPVFVTGSDEWAAEHGAFQATYLALAPDAGLHA